MVDYARDLAPWITLGVAVELLMEAGATEGDARIWLTEEIKNRSVKVYGIPALSCAVLLAEEIDWPASEIWEKVPGMVSILRGGICQEIKSTRRRTRITVSRTDVLALRERVKALAPAPLAGRGRKPGGATREQEIFDTIRKMLANGEIEFERGGKTRAAEQLARTFPGYAVDTIRRKINQEIGARKLKSG